MCTARAPTTPSTRCPSARVVQAYGGRTAIVGDPKDHATRELIARIADRGSTRSDDRDRARWRSADPEPDPHRPPRRARRHRARHSRGGGAAPRVSRRREIDWLVSAKHREILDLVPCSTGGWSSTIAAAPRGGMSLLAAIARDQADALRRGDRSAGAHQVGDHRAALGRAAGRSASPRRYARESLARFFYTDVHDPGGDGIYAPRETRHVVEINLGLLERARPDAGDRPSFRSPRDASPCRRADGDGDGRTLRAAQSRRGLAEQAMAAGAAGGARRRPARAARPDVGRAVGARRARTGRGGRGGRGRRRDARAGDDDCRCRGAGARRRRHGVRRHGADAHRAPPSARRSSASTVRRGPSATVRGCRTTRPCRARACASVTISGSAGASRMCLLDIEVDEVLAAVERRLAAERAAAAHDAHEATGAPARAARLSVAVVVLWLAQPTAATARLGRRSSRSSAKALRIWAAGHLNKSREVTVVRALSVVRAPAVRRVVGDGRRAGASRPAACVVAAADRGVSRRRRSPRRSAARSVSPRDVRRAIRSVSG